MSTYATADPEMLALAAGGAAILIGTRSGIFGLSLTLAEAWRHGTDEEVDHVVPTASGIFYSQVGAGVGAVSDAGAALWSVDDGAGYDALVPGQGLVVGARLQGTVHGFDPSDGSVAWSVTDTAAPVRGLDVSGQTVLYAGGGFVQGLNLIDGTVLWEWSPGAAPVGVAAP